MTDIRRLFIGCEEAKKGPDGWWTNASGIKAHLNKSGTQLILVGVDSQEVETVDFTVYPAAIKGSAKAVDIYVPSDDKKFSIDVKVFSKGFGSIDSYVATLCKSEAKPAAPTSGDQLRLGPPPAKTPAAPAPTAAAKPAAPSAAPKSKLIDVNVVEAPELRFGNNPNTEIKLAATIGGEQMTARYKGTIVLKHDPKNTTYRITFVNVRQVTNLKRFPDQLDGTLHITLTAELIEKSDAGPEVETPLAPVLTTLPFLLSEGKLRIALDPTPAPVPKPTAAPGPPSDAEEKQIRALLAELTTDPAKQQKIRDALSGVAKSQGKPLLEVLRTAVEQRRKAAPPPAPTPAPTPAPAVPAPKPAPATPPAPPPTSPDKTELEIRALLAKLTADATQQQRVREALASVAHRQGKPLLTVLREAVASRKTTSAAPAPAPKPAASPPAPKSETRTSGLFGPPSGGPKAHDYGTGVQHIDATAIDTRKFSLPRADMTKPEDVETARAVAATVNPAAISVATAQSLAEAVAAAGGTVAYEAEKEVRINGKTVPWAICRLPTESKERMRTFTAAIKYLHKLATDRSKGGNGARTYQLMTITLDQPRLMSTLDGEIRAAYALVNASGTNIGGAMSYSYVYDKPTSAGALRESYTDAAGRVTLDHNTLAILLVPSAAVDLKTTNDGGKTIFRALNEALRTSQPSSEAATSSANSTVKKVKDDRELRRVLTGLPAGHQAVILFTAGWCGPCKTYKPRFQEFAAVAGENYHFLQVQLEEEKDEPLFPGAERLADDFGVEEIPTVIVVDHRGKRRTIKDGYKLLAELGIVRS